MSFWEILPFIIVGAIIIYILIKCAPLIGALLQLIAVLYWFLCNAFEWVVKPLAFLWNKIKLLLCKVPFIHRLVDKKGSLDNRLDRFGGLSCLVLLGASVLFIAISLLASWKQGVLEDSLRDILLNNTFGSFLNLFETGFSLTPGLLISVCFASFLAHICIDKADRVKWYIWIPYCVIFIGMSSILSSYLTGIFDTVGTWGYNSIVSLWNNTSTSLAVKILRFVPLAVLAYFAVISLVIAIREYFCSVLFGIVGLIALLIVALLLHLFHASQIWNDIFVAVTVIGSIIGIEKIRGNIEKGMTEKAETEEETPVIY